MKGNDSELTFKHVYFGIDISSILKKRNAYNLYKLEERPFLGPTTTNEQLSFLMAN